MSDAWEELFALAEGRGSQQEPEETTTFFTTDAPETNKTTSDPRTISSPHERSFKKARRSNAQRTASELNDDGYLEGRCYPETLDLEGCRLSRSFLLARNNTSRPLCKRWKHAKPPHHGRCCERCKRPPGDHVLKLDEEADESINDVTRTNPGSRTPTPKSWMALFVTLRNIRCWSRVYWLSTNSSSPDAVIKSAPSTTQMSDWILHLPMLWPSAVSRTGLIYEKVLHMAAAAKTLVEEANEAEKHVTAVAENRRLTSGLMEECIRCIIACGQVYFQIYYWCISNAVGNGAATTAEIPHPVSYFGEWSDYDETIAADFLLLKADGNDDMIQLLQSHFGLFNHDGESDRTRHALLTLHRLRRNETIALFLGWNPPAITSKKVVGVSSLEEHHATLAPALLQDWRDSCRDFLCHLYCYATVSSQILVELYSDFLEHFGIHSIVEVGAGTGYMARLLQKHLPTTTVLAFDVAPASTGNEYHAATPLFTSVKVGTATNYLTAQNVRNKHEHQPSLALLLCYPPPESPMALHALRNYVQHCKQRKQSSAPPTLIHIGEFKGLTGSKQFEEYLLQHFHCIRRWPCLTWGTDAAEVTIWQRILPTHRDTSLLLPCSQCQQQEAVRRCRWMRSLRYCSRACYISHASVRRRLLSVSFAVVSLQLEVDDVNDFANEQYYSSL